VLISVLEESVHDAQCVVTAQEPSTIINVSIIMLTNHTIQYSNIVLNVCTEVTQKDRGFVSFKLSQGIIIFF